MSVFLAGGVDMWKCSNCEFFGEPRGFEMMEKHRDEVGAGHGEALIGSLKWVLLWKAET